MFLKSLRSNKNHEKTQHSTLLNFGSGINSNSYVAVLTTFGRVVAQRASPLKAEGLKFKSWHLLLKKKKD